jgi:hypothetical protein
VLFQRRVYRPGSLLTTGTAPTQNIGSVITAFDTANGPAQETVLRSPLADGSIVVTTPSGLQLYTPVTRTYNGAAYQLVSGTAIPNFGVWPRLPSSYTEPTSADGSPSFARVGQDAAGVPIYTPGGAPVTTGFAVGPNMPASDPTAANPYWTWWEPLVTP